MVSGEPFLPFFLLVLLYLVLPTFPSYYPPFASSSSYTCNALLPPSLSPSSSPPLYPPPPPPPLTPPPPPCTHSNVRNTKLRVKSTYGYVTSIFFPLSRAQARGEIDRARIGVKFIFRLDDDEEQKRTRRVTPPGCPRDFPEARNAPRAEATPLGSLESVVT